MVFMLPFERENKKLSAYFSVFELSENETHASEICEYLLTQQTKSLGSLNLSCSCLSPNDLEIKSHSAMPIWRYF